MKKWRVGSFTFGIALIGAGVLFLLGNFTDIDIFSLIKNFWPLLLVVTGFEILLMIILQHTGKNIIKFDFLSVLLILLIFLTGFSISSADYIKSNFFTENNISGIKNNIKNFIDTEFNKDTLSENIYEESSSYSRQFTYDMKDIKKVGFALSYCEINISPSPNDILTIDVSATINSNGVQAEDLESAFSFSKSGDTVTFTGKLMEKNTNIKNLFKTNRQVMEIKDIKYTITLPAEINIKTNCDFSSLTVNGFDAGLDIKNSYGKTEILSCKGDSNIENQFADSTIKDFSGGSLKMDFSYGAVTLENIKADISLLSSFGNVEAAEIYGNIYIKNNESNLNLTEKEIVTGNMTVESEFGIVSIVLNKNQNGSFYAKNSFANLTTNYPGATEKENEKKFNENTLTWGTEKNPEFVFRGSYGAMDINFNP